MTTHRLRNAAITLGVVFVISLALAALIGQHNDGPLGDLPEWLGSAAYVIWLLSALLLVLLAVTVVVLRVRRGRPARHEGTRG